MNDPHNPAAADPSELQAKAAQLVALLGQRVLGQHQLIERLVLALLCDAHLLVEGVPGTAKTTAIKELASSIEGEFRRIQFTPDLLPADITGSEVFRIELSQFEFRRGPIFANLLLADEINRAPAKVQSALLEAMAERQVTIGERSYDLPSLFLVMATQNPLENAGTHPLPEAQLDRFSMYVRVGYPSPDIERQILELARAEAAAQIESRDPRGGRPGAARSHPMSIEEVHTARLAAARVHLAPALERYLIELVVASREPKRYSNELDAWIAHGASPRASIALDRLSRARAWLHGRDFVLPDDIQDLAVDVLAHRIIASFEAQAQGIDNVSIVRALLENVSVP